MIYPIGADDLRYGNFSAFKDAQSPAVRGLALENKFRQK
jgi:hypothetical protein